MPCKKCIAYRSLSFYIYVDVYIYLWYFFFFLYVFTLFVCLYCVLFCAFPFHLIWWPVSACDIFGFIDAVVSVIFESWCRLRFFPSVFFFFHSLCWNCPSKQVRYICKRSALLVSSRTLIFNLPFSLLHLEHSFVYNYSFGLFYSHHLRNCIQIQWVHLTKSAFSSNSYARFSWKSL